MMQPASIASFASHSGVPHLYTDMALESLIDKISVDRASDKLEGFDIQQWAAFAKKRSNIASSICKELGRLKAQASSNFPNGSWFGSSLSDRSLGWQLFDFFQIQARRCRGLSCARFADSSSLAKVLFEAIGARY